MNGYQYLGLNERRDLYRTVREANRGPTAAPSFDDYREFKCNRHLDEEPLFRDYFPTIAHSTASGHRMRGGKIRGSPYCGLPAASSWHP